MQFDREIQNAAQAFRYIESFLNLEKIKPQKNEYRLNRMERLNDILGHPWKGTQIVHLAGSKGKGSCAHMFESIYRAAGYKTGLYTSPHISSYAERIKINGRPSGDKQICEVMPPIQRAAEIMYNEDDPPSFFELLTTMAFMIFKEANCDIIILETGLGGRLDATNIVTPTASIILPIELEHTDYLGDTIAQIAAEKAGIIKENVPVFVSGQHEDALQVIQEKAQSTQSPLIDCSTSISNTAYGDSGIRGKLVYCDSNETLELEVGIPAEVQLMNAGLVYRTVGRLSPDMDKSIIKSSLKELHIKGRMHIVSKHPLCVFDGSHTPKSVAYALQGFNGLIKSAGISGKKVLLFACAEDKDYKGMLAALVDDFDTVVISKPSSFKPSKPQQLFDFIQETYPDKQSIMETQQQEALDKCIEFAGNTGAVLVCGSFFLLGELYQH